MNNLDFLEEMLKDTNDKVLSQNFLKSNFEDNVWFLDLGAKNYSKVDFDIIIHDNYRLIKNTDLLNTIKYWILYVSYPKNGIELSSRSILKNTVNVITLIDVLNFEKLLDIKGKGLSYLNENHIKHILLRLSTSNKKSESAYSLSSNLSDYFQNNIKNKFNNIHNDIEVNFDLPNNLNLNKEEILLFKSWIKENETNKTSHQNTLYKISEEYSQNNLLKNIWIPNQYPKILKVNDFNEYYKEYKSYYVKNEDSLIEESSFNSYKESFIKLFEIKNDTKFNLMLPNKNIDFDLINNLKIKTKQSNRFQTVPSESVFKAIKKAIEFHYEFSKDILISYENIIKYMKNNNLKKLGANNQEWLKNCFTEKIKNIGVETWYLPLKENRFNNIRKNKSFFALLRIYYGMVQVVVGALMARRQSELISLKNNKCINDLNKTLMFLQSKSSKKVFGVKNTLSLPIDDMAIDMIKNIEKINNLLESHSDCPLFLTPLYNNPLNKNKELKSTTYNANLDYFFDYIEMDKIDNKRLYFRQHQLRRFFAMTFFWNYEGNMDTLRWFLGHTDVEHLYHYITESTKGSILKNVKTQYLIENEKNNLDLINLIKNEYNTENFELLEEEDINYYIEDLIDKEKIDIEPEFFVDDNNKKYEILLKIKGDNNE